MTVAGCVGADPEGGGGSDTDSGRADGPSGSSGSSGGADAASDGPAPPSGPCDLEKPFSKPAKIAEVSTPSGHEEGPRLSPDGQELFVNEVVTAGTKPAAGIVRYLLGKDGKWGSRTALAVNDLGDGGLMHSRDSRGHERRQDGVLPPRRPVQLRSRHLQDHADRAQTVVVITDSGQRDRV